MVEIMTLPLTDLDQNVKFSLNSSNTVQVMLQTCDRQLGQ
jgi:hypothetical protein